MSIPFINRAPLGSEVELIRLAISSFKDGSGQEKDSLGNTRAGWRDLERVVSEIIGGHAPEGKGVFDVVIGSKSEKNIFYGISVKSKQLTRVSAISDLDVNGRVYMELCNSPAKLWEPIKYNGIRESDFGKSSVANSIGESLLATVKSWHSSYKAAFEARNKGKVFDLEKSIHLVVSYDNPSSDEEREYQLHAFSLDFPKNIRWEFSSARCLKGYDPDYPSETLLDWYGLSGGQLKYYPRASTSIYKSPRFRLETPRCLSISEKASRYWPAEWIQASGVVSLTKAQLINELEAFSIIIDDNVAKAGLEDLVKLLKSP